MERIRIQIFANVFQGMIGSHELAAVGKVDAIDVVLELAPTRAEPEVGATSRELVDGGDGVGEHGGVAIAH